MNVNRLLRDPADNMARENTKNKAAGRRHEQQNNSIGGKENFHIMAVLPNNVYFKIYFHQQQFLEDFIEKLYHLH